MTKLTNPKHKYHHLTMTSLDPEENTAQVVETSVTNKSISKDYSHPDDHTRQNKMCDSPYCHTVVSYFRVS